MLRNVSIIGTTQRNKDQTTKTQCDNFKFSLLLSLSSVLLLFNKSFKTVAFV